MATMLRTFLLVLCLLTPGMGAAEDPFFRTDGLNAGLGAPPDAVDRRTPRDAVASFLRAAEAGDFQTASHVLDLSDIDPAVQPVEGEIRARQLHSVLERKAVIDWSLLSQRPDALQVLGGQQQAQAGEPRRSLLIRELDLDPVPSAIRLNRIKPGEDADPVWVFPRETVADLPALYAAYGPSALEAVLPSWARAEGPFGLMWWEFLALPLLAAAVGLLVWAMHNAFRFMRQSSDRGMVRGVIHACRNPAILAAVTALVQWVSADVFVFSGAIDTVLSPLIAIGYVTAVLLFVVNVLDAVLDNLLDPGEEVDLTESERSDARSTATRLNAAKRILTVVVFLIGVGIVLSSADVFRGLGLSLLASAGALTLVLGYAARNVLANIMASLQIALNQSARVGDRVVYKGELCHVERIHMTFVQLRDWDGTRVIVPVGEFVSETFSNWTLQEPAMLRILKFKLAHQADVQTLREAFEQILDQLSGEELGPELGDLSEASVNVAGQDVFGLDVWFSTPCKDPNTSWEVACTVRERLAARITEIEDEKGTAIFPDATPAEAA